LLASASLRKTLKPFSALPARVDLIARINKARTQHFFALVTHMRAQNVGKRHTIATPKRVQYGFMFLQRHRPTWR
jgi:hypothetical protein